MNCNPQNKRETGRMLKLNLCVIFLICIFALCGCTKKTGETVIKFASWGSKSEVNIIKPILEDFEKENPYIKVEFMHIPQNYFQKIHLLFASNTPPDVIFINNLYLPVYANAGVLREINDSGKMINKNDFYPSSIKTLSYKNKLYAVPRDVSNLVIYYNKDIFNKKKVPYPAKNWTFDDFLNTAIKLTDKNTFGISFENDSLFYLPYLMSEGGGILSDDLNEVIINSPSSQRGIKFYSDLRKKYHVAPFKSESASATAAQMFLQQKLAMHLSGRWLTPKYREEADFDWDITAFPAGSKGSIVPADASGWAISKASKHPYEAELLVKYLSSYDSIKKFCESGLIMPARKDIANSKYFLDGKKPESANIFIQAAETSKPTPVSVNYKEIVDKINKQLEPVFE